MVQPTVFVQFETRNESNPVAMAIGLIAKSVGGVLVDQLVDEQEVEADIAVVNTVEVALRLLKETENTLVFLGYLGNTGYCASEKEALAFAARFPRVKAGPFVEAKGEENLMIALMRTIAEMGKEDR
ncbi:MAG: hypothetical protein HYT38_00055 [Candidatus Sungbacteria bacterium]|uniref:Uncharacterized protein n=1 Tax=Candidatus Sungiibacteriota bacterium TaxID=2750080 RepID=A0A931YD35_9BACT|nr:hypothetical protein [Candidatus Sungbacteria bacterium]MBI2465681.1 hypothetical protein [Candidatus Sungbacteria bacterium]